MQISNASGQKLIINDIKLASGQPLEIAAGATIKIFDEDAERSASLHALITAGSITVASETTEPVDMLHGKLDALSDALDTLTARVAALESAS